MAIIIIRIMCLFTAYYILPSRHVQSLTDVGQLQVEDGGRQYVVLVHCSGSQGAVCVGYSITVMI